MKHLSVILFAFAFAAVTPSAFAELTKSRQQLAKFKQERTNQAHAKEAQKLLAEVLDTINDEIMPYPKVRADAELKSKLQKAKITCAKNPAAEACLVDMDAAFDRAITLVDAAAAAKTSTPKKVAPKK